MKNIDLTGKIALVTGGSAGIGLSVAESLCQAGASVAIVGRRKDALEDAKRHIAKRYPNAEIFAVSADASKVEDIRKMVNQVIQRFGRIDILVNNAGTNVLNEAFDVTEAEWAPYNIQVNAIAPTFVETPLTRPMLENKEFYEEVIRRIPMGKLAQPEDVAGAVLYLASDLSNFVTGHTLPVDGGWVAW